MLLMPSRASQAAHRSTSASGPAETTFTAPVGGTIQIAVSDRDVIFRLLQRERIPRTSLPTLVMRLADLLSCPISARVGHRFGAARINCSFSRISSAQQGETPLVQYAAWRPQACVRT